MNAEFLPRLKARRVSHPGAEEAASRRVAELNGPEAVAIENELRLVDLKIRELHATLRLVHESRDQF